MTAEMIPLRRNEPVGVVALSGPVDPDELARGLRVVEGWGHPVVTAPNLADRTRYLAGDDTARIAGLEAVLDQNVRVVLTARGGYGVTRLLDRLPWDRLVETGVTVVGFSDVTALTAPLVCRGGSLQVHGPMVAAGLEHPGNAARLRRVLSGGLRSEPLFRFQAPQVVRDGTATGRLMGGNLSLLVSLIGTPWAPDLDGAVVALEEVSEPAYRLDRMLTHLKASGMFRGVKALISGILRCCPEMDERSDEWRDLLVEAAPRGVPVVTGLPFGHTEVNLAFPLGAQVEVATADGVVAWRT